MPANMNKPTILIVMGLVAIHAIWILLGLLGITTTPPTTMTPVLILALDIIILLGLYNKHTWTWWLLLFGSISAIINTLITILQRQATTANIIVFIIYIILLLSLTHRDTVEEYKPNTIFIKGW